MSFWRASNKIPITQTETAITANNGLSFSENQIIQLEVPPSVEFFQPRESYLKWDVKLQMPAGVKPTRLQLDAEIGAQSLIKNLRIYSSHESGGVLLEEILDYNALVSIKYSYDTDDTMRNKRALTEGSTAWRPDTRGTQGTGKSQGNDSQTNPYFRKAVLSAGDQRVEFENTDFVTAKCILPLHSGIFSSERVYPNMLTGLRVEIELEENKKVIKQLESVMLYRKLWLNPIFDSRTGVALGAKTPWKAGDGAIGSFYVRLDNSNNTPATCPFVVGEYFGIANALGVESTFTTANGDNIMQVSQINASANASGNDGLLEIVLVSATTLSSADIETIDDEVHFYLYSKSVYKNHKTPASEVSYAATYQVDNVELILSQLDMGSTYRADMMKKMKEGGRIGFDILSFTNYKTSQLKTDVVANLRVPIDNSRCRSILCMATDSTIYNINQMIGAYDQYDIYGTYNSQTALPDGNGNGTSQSARGGLTGISDNLRDYNFFYDGKLQPSRAVSTAKISSKYSIDAMPIIETEKALIQANIPAKSLLQFNENFLVSRAFSLNQGVEDLRNKDFSLQLRYTANGSKDHLWYMFLSHLRRIDIKSGNISVIR
tara:strand:- start:305 stop:2116 length:1812 start_codon:yes stop_codon:yes gene_type:complete